MDSDNQQVLGGLLLGRTQTNFETSPGTENRLRGGIKHPEAVRQNVVMDLVRGDINNRVLDSNNYTREEEVLMFLKQSPLEGLLFQMKFLKI